MFNKKLYTTLKLFRFLLFPLYFISFLIPKQNNLWVFGAHHNRFSENSKALFLYTSELKNIDITPVWISADKELCKTLQKDKYLAYYKWSIQGLYSSLRAKYYFYNVYSDDINFYTSGNTTLVNLWHGIPLKKIEFDDTTGILRKQFNSIFSYLYRFFKPYPFISPDYLLSTSSDVSDNLSTAFKIDKVRCLELGYPRVDLFFQNIQEQEIQEQKTIFYLPTWRAKQNNIVKLAFPDLQKLDHLLESINANLYIKPHPNDIIDLKNTKNIIFIDSNKDINELLLQSDYLITDYSSVYFDYLLLDKEILFYPFDLDTYTQNEREFYYDYDSVTPGKKIYNFDELLESLKDLDTLDYKKERTMLRDKLWKYQDNNSAKRIVEYFYNRSLK